MAYSIERWDVLKIRGWPGLRSLSSDEGVLHASPYLPMQNLLKITPSRSSELNSPVIELS